MEKMDIKEKQRLASQTLFHGMGLGLSCSPIGKIMIDVLFGEKAHFRREPIWFEVVNLDSPYHALLGRPALAKFMAVPHYAYLKMKMPGPKGIITITGDYQKSLMCATASSRLAESLVIAEEKRLLDRVVAMAGEQPAIPSDPKDGTIHRRDDKNDAYQIIQFDTYGLRVDLNHGDDKGKVLNRKESELNLPDLLLARKTPQDSKDARVLNAGEQKRFVMASTPIIFILIGVPLGIRSQRSGRGANFDLALFNFLLFYILFTLAKTLVVDLGLHALFMWLPVVVFTIVGLFLLRAAANEREINFSLSAFFKGKD
jgi:hypothetical protein